MDINTVTILLNVKECKIDSPSLQMAISSLEPHVVFMTTSIGY